MDVYMSAVDVMANYLVDGGAGGVGMVGVNGAGLEMDMGHLFGGGVGAGIGIRQVHGALGGPLGDIKNTP